MSVLRFFIQGIVKVIKHLYNAVSYAEKIFVAGDINAMQYTIHAEKDIASETFRKHIDKHIQSFAVTLRDFASDIPYLQMTFGCNKKRKIYSGKFILHLPKQTLVAFLKETTPHGVINKGFHLLKKECMKYKGKHFVSDSTYFDRRSIV